MDRIPSQLGYLVLNEEGAVLSSSGELENDERTADTIMGLIQLTGQLDPSAFAAAPAGGPVAVVGAAVSASGGDNAGGDSAEGIRRISIVYEDFCYSVCLSNRRLYIVKRAINLATPPDQQQQETEGTADAHQTVA